MPSQEEQSNKTLGNHYLKNQADQQGSGTRRTQRYPAPNGRQALFPATQSAVEPSHYHASKQGKETVNPATQVQNNDNQSSQGAHCSYGGTLPEKSLNIHFTEKAEKQLEKLNGDPRFGGDAKAVHKEIVQKYTETNYPHAKRVNVRKAAHLGGSDPSEPEHITVSVKGPKLDGKGVHIYLKYEGSKTPAASSDVTSGVRAPRG